ncbi:hypothetical protein [[Eubacterium] cellulosolvens]
MNYHLHSRLLLISLTSLFFLSIITSNIVFASSNNWSEVTRFTGSGTEHYTTDFFNCEHVEWRIRWEYVPHPSLPFLALFSVYTYPQGEDVSYIDSIIKTGNNDTNGTSYIHNNDGTFYSKINVATTESYTIIIEQDLNSIPEFPSWIILPMFLIGSVIALFVGKKININAKS